MLAVKSTVYPDGFRITWVNGMPKHPELIMDSQLYNRWALYVHNLVFNIKGVNKVRAGGVCYSDGQDSALRLAKEILG
jgi:hypothetical protein